MSQLLVFQSFADKELALRTAATLENHGIAVAVEENLLPLDSNFIGQQFSNPYVVKIPGQQFLKADALLMEHTVIDLNEVDEDYMLLSFTDQELVDVMKNRSEWGIYNYKLAEKLLEQRKVAIADEEIKAARTEALVKEAKPQSYDKFWIFLGYAMAVYIGIGPVLLTFAALFALVVGYRLFFTRKTLSDGTRIRAYRKSVRMHGLIIFGVTLLLLLYRFIAAISGEN